MQDESANEEDSPSKPEIRWKTHKKRGMVLFSSENESLLIDKLVLEMQPAQVELDVPGLPAHLIFMCVRYVDDKNDERLMQDLLTNVVKSIRKVVKVGYLTR